MNTPARTLALAQEQTRKAVIGYFYGQAFVSIAEFQEVIAAFGNQRGLPESAFPQIADRIKNEVALFKVSGS